jgi:O-methyltransferase domain/Dimerisation domain
MVNNGPMADSAGPPAIRSGAIGMPARPLAPRGYRGGMSDRSRTATLRRLMNGYQVTQAIHVAAVLGIADHLAGGPLDAATLAARTDTDPVALYRLLRALGTVDILTESPGRIFGTTELGAGLRRDADPPIVGWAAFNGRPYHWAAWSGLQHSVRTGENAFRAVHGMSPWEYRAAHPEEGATFDDAMTALSRSVIPAVLDAYDFGRFPVIADVGGGRGAVLAAILSRHPGSRGILFDQPHVVAGAPELLGAAGVTERCEVAVGSFFDRVPGGADAYVLKDILHDWITEDALRILAVIRRDMPAGARLVVVERLLDTEGFAAEVAFSDLNMLTGPGGQEHSAADFVELLAVAGLKVTAVVRTDTAVSVIEAMPT